MGASKSKALCRAAGDGNLNKVKDIVEKGVDVNSQVHGSTPLHSAVSHCQLEVVKYLVDNDADVNMVDKKGRTPLHLAVSCEDPYDFSDNFVLKFLDIIDGIQKEVIGDDENADSWIKSSRSHVYSLMRKFCQDRLEIVKYLVMRGADLSVKNKEGKTPIDIARSKNDRNDIVNFLSETRDPRITELRKLINEFESLPRERKTGGRFIVDKNIWDINRDLAILNLREIINLFNRYPKLIDWSGKYRGKFTFGTRLSNEVPENKGTIACANVECIWLGSNYFSLSLDDFRETCRTNQREQMRDDGILRAWHSRANPWELQTVRHEFGHVFQFLFQEVMAEQNPKYKDRDVYCNEFKHFLLDFAEYEDWDENLPQTSKYGLKNDREWFAESFANAQNGLDHRPFEDDQSLSDEQNKKQRKMMKEARLVGRFALNKASDFGYSSSIKP